MRRRKRCRRYYDAWDASRTKKEWARLVRVDQKRFNGDHRRWWIEGVEVPRVRAFSKEEILSRIPEAFVKAARDSHVEMFLHEWDK